MAAAILSRATPAASLNSSQAQTSAPVFEYRCMFTHDVRKKAKKWHDGSLRFHTFNKRVMVYDDTKNLVGSLHYRSQEDFAEGLELSLDSHVLVQVEDRLGETSTDLTPLIGRQNQDGSSQSGRHNAPTRATLSRINAANTQIKPKSIKELLAGSRGQIGRARIPCTSPYEQRHPLVESQPVYPDPKRRRIDNGKENDTESISGSGQVVGNTPNRPSALSVSSKVVVDISSADESHSPPPPIRQQKPSLQSSSRSKEPSSPNPATSAPAKRKGTPLVSTDGKRRKDKARDGSGSALPPPPREKERAEKVSKTKASKTTSTGAAAEVLVRPHVGTKIASGSMYAPPTIRRLPGPRTSLRFAAKKPRPRLMYRALLENSSNPASIVRDGSATRPAMESRSSPSYQDHEQVGRRPRLRNLIENDRMFAPSQIARQSTAPDEGVLDEAVPSSPSTSQKSSVSQDVEPASPGTHAHATLAPPDEDTTETIPDSPLFLPQTTSQASPTHDRHIALEDGPFPSLTQALQHATPKRSTALATTPSEVSQNASNIVLGSNDPPSSPVFHRRLSVNEEAQEVEVRMSPSTSGAPSRSLLREPQGSRQSLPSPPRALPPQVRLFRRVVSENVPPTRASPEVSSPDNSMDEDSLNDMLEESPSADMSPRSRKLRTQPQSFSDPVDIHPKTPTPQSVLSSPAVDSSAPSPRNDDVPGPPSQLPSEEEPDTPKTTYLPVEDSGPWTSTEAFLLFDRWPPGRQKPPYATATATATSVPANISASSDSGIGARNGQSLNTSMMSKKKYGTFGSAKFVSQR